MTIRLTVTQEQRFDRTPDGAIWASTEGWYSYWTRYLDVFDEVTVLARVRDVPAVPYGRNRADGANVSFSAVPHYLGPTQYLVRAEAVKAAIRNAVGRSEAVILRTPGQVSFCAESLFHGTSRPYGVEVVGDPRDVFSPGAVKHPLRSFFRWWFSRRLRRVCAGAAAAVYVTQHALQNRYPCPSFSIHCSDIDLAPSSFSMRRNEAPVGVDRPFTVVTVGSLDQLYKSPDVLIDAIALCVQDGLEIRLTVIGDGRYRQELEKRAVGKNLGQRISFLGQIPSGEPVRAQLDRADLFALPSRADGLPRAMIEAMARGLPCIGSTIGGIPELLPPEDLVPPDDPVALARKICEVAADPDRMAGMGRRNLEKAKEFRREVLCARQRAFYEELRNGTAEWLKTVGRAI